MDNRHHHMICGWNRTGTSEVSPPPPPPHPNVQPLETDGLLNLSFKGENQVVETVFSSNRIPDGWSRRPLFCPGNLLRLPNRKVTHGRRACGAGGAGGEGTARRLRTAQAFGRPVAAIEALDQFLPSRRQLLSLVQRVLPPGRNPAPFPLTPRWRGGQGCVTKLSW